MTELLFYEERLLDNLTDILFRPLSPQTPPGTDNLSTLHPPISQSSVYVYRDLLTVIVALTSKIWECLQTEGLP